jgi:hypothetical protein
MRTDNVRIYYNNGEAQLIKDMKTNEPSGVRQFSDLLQLLFILVEPLGCRSLGFDQIPNAQHRGLLILSNVIQRILSDECETYSV